MSKSITAIGLLALLGLAPSGAGAGEGPEVRRLGRTVAQYRDGLVRAAISTKYAANRLDQAWTVLDFCVAPETGKPVVIAREDVSLVAEDGTVLPMPTQRAMAEGLPDVRNVLHAAEIITDPLLGYFPYSEYERRLKFFAIPGESIVLDEEVVTLNRLGRAWLFFRSPSGKWGGRYQLVIRNKGLNIRIPFQLPPTDFPEKEKDPKVVPW